MQSTGSEAPGPGEEARTLAESDRAGILDMLQRIPVFGGISHGALRRILKRAGSVDVRKDHYFFHEGDRGQAMFILVTGRVAVVKTLDGLDYELQRMEPGDCFGELELIDFCPRAASVRAVEDCWAVEVTVSVLHEVFKADETSYAMLQMNMGREVSRRLRRLDAEFTGLLPTAGSTRNGGAESAGEGDRREGEASAGTSRCVVCTKHMRAREEHWEVRHDDWSYVVCCPLCAERFKENPELFLGGPPSDSTAGGSVEGCPSQVLRIKTP